MRTTQKQQKLMLNKETVTRLDQEMNQVKGGILTTDCASRIRIMCDTAKCTGYCIL